ncbi:Hypothetical protein NCS54_01341900 [Fusarium falciforme]|uniref:Hypothetical protein n=1 Tax=Fusarium falciforme TaxID=195108 RepID=UPI002301FB11|nr:Hypothetical protein NCS54_01341900 [Fusarium falciforme]WAO95778.1 Hypothetical protein NCS54_01341900 [Fusarium falciforme]
MSEGESSKRPSLRSETTYAPESRRPRAQTLSNILEPPKHDHDRVLVESPSKHAIRTDSEYKGSLARQRSTSMPPVEVYRDTRAHSVQANGSWDSLSSSSSSDDDDENFDITCNPCRAKDVGVRLEFNVYQDLDDELEEFSRFIRRGEFGTAKIFFREHLLAHITNPWVFVQYAEMLFQMGDYKSLLQLDSEPVFRRIRLRDRHEDVEAMRRLEINWRLIKAVCLSCTQHELQPVLDEICQPHQIIPVRGDVGSTEIRIICLAMALMDYANRRNVGMRALPSNLADWGNWKQLYELLQAQGRIWDFRDLFTTACLCFSIKSAEEQLLGSRTILEAIAEDWSMPMNDDESTLLALVDLLTTMALNRINHVEDHRLSKEYLAHASIVVEAVTTVYPHLTKSRPFLQFIVTQSSISLGKGTGNRLAYNYLTDFPGLTAFSLDLELPFYVPVRRENPGWDPPDLPENTFGPLEMALEASRSMDDYKMEGLCLRALALRSREPSRFFEELARVQKNTQQDMRGYLMTCLSKYLVVKDRDSREDLLTDLNGFGWWQETSNLLNPDKACARDIIQHALSPPHQTHFSKSIEAGFRHYQWLPDTFQGFIDQHMETPRRKSSTAMRHRIKQHLPRPSTAILAPPRPPADERHSAPSDHSDDSQDDSEENPDTALMRPSRERMRAISEEQEDTTEDRKISVEIRSPPFLIASGMPPTTITSKPTVEDEARDEQNDMY